MFASAEQRFRRLQTDVLLRSVTSGRVARRIATFGGDFTNNGLALSPDGHAVYLTLIPHKQGSRNLLIERLDVASHKHGLVAEGWEPSLSPNGRLLAYTTISGRSESVTVKDLATGFTRSVNVDNAVGRGHVLEEMPAGWLSDDTTLALPVGLAPKLVSGPTPARTSRTATGSATIRLVVVHAVPGQPLHVHRTVVAGLHGHPEILGTDARSQKTLIAASLTRAGEALDEIDLSSTTATACRILSIRGGLVLGFDPSGRELVYLLGSSPPALWRATIEGGRLVSRTRLLKRSRAGAIAW
jgi:hypothetical protein